MYSLGLASCTLALTRPRLFDIAPPSPMAQVGFTEEDYIGLFDETPIPRKQKEAAGMGAGNEKNK